MTKEIVHPTESRRNGFVLPGDLYPLEDGQHPDAPWAPQSHLDAMLTITYCDGLGLPPLRQMEVLYTVANNLFKKIGDNYALVITRGAGLELAGFGEYGPGYNPIRNDGMYESHNIPVNDFDLHVLTPGNGDHKAVLAQIRDGMTQGADVMLKHPSLKYLTPYVVLLSDPNVWNMPQYCKLNLNYFRWDPVTTLEIHHENLPDERVEKFFGHYQIGKSNLIGSPMCLGLPDKNGKLRFYIWQPFPTETKWDDHQISLSAPDTFGESPFCIPQAARFALFQIQASLVTGIPAEMEENTIGVMRNAIAKHNADLTEEQRAKAIKQLNTTLFLAGRLEQSCKDFSGNDTYMNYALGDFKQFAAKTLDRIGWGDAVLGMSVTEYLEQMSENN